MGWINYIYSIFLANRIKDLNFRRRKSVLDHTVTHELSHGIWNKLNPNNPPGINRIWSNWNEGFATYLEDELLKDIYPKHIRNTEKQGVYKRGYKSVERLVTHYGIEVLLDIPRNWEMYDKQLNQSLT